MHGLNKRFKNDPIDLLRRLVLVTLPGQPCPTCHCVMDLGTGRWDGANAYARPEPMILTFDLMAGAFPANVPLGFEFTAALGAFNARPAGLAHDNAAAKYMALQVLKVGHARATSPVGRMTNEYRAYWLPWAHQGTKELHLNDRSVKFFFTAMVSGCTIAIATPAAGAADVYVTHIAWDPGLNAPAGWGGALLAGASEDARRLSAERAFYTARGAAGTRVQSVTMRPDPLAVVAGITAAATPSVVIPALPVAGASAAPAGHARFFYASTPAPLAGAPNPGMAFIAGWRGANDDWHFAVQKHPGGYNAAGVGAALNALLVRPLGLQLLS